MGPTLDEVHEDQVTRQGTLEVKDVQAMADEKAVRTLDEKNTVTANVDHVQSSSHQPQRGTSKLFGLSREIYSQQTYKNAFQQGQAVVWKFGKFVGPGALITVAYIDPDNYQTDISAGAIFGYKLLFIVLVSNLIAVFLQVWQQYLCFLLSLEYMLKCK